MKFLKVKSISDVITNSSTEVFCCRMDDKFNELRAKAPYVDGFIKFLNTEDDVKKFIIDHIWNLWDDSYWVRGNMFDADDENAPSIDDVVEEIKEDEDKFWAKYRERFLYLIGCAYGAACDNEYSWEDIDTAFYKYIELSQKQGFEAGRTS